MLRKGFKAGEKKAFPCICNASSGIVATVQLYQNRKKFLVQIYSYK